MPYTATPHLNPPAQRGGGGGAEGGGPGGEWSRPVLNRRRVCCVASVCLIEVICEGGVCVCVWKGEGGHW